MNIDEMIAVLQAAKADKQLQYRVKGIDAVDVWRDVPPTTGYFGRKFMPHFGDCDYRVKPEPREFWLCWFGQGANIFGYTSEADARKHCMCEHIKVREVLE